MTAYTNHGKTSSAKRHSGRKSQLSEVDHRTLKRNVSKNPVTAAAKVTAEIRIYLEGPVFIKNKKSDESFPNPTSTAELQLLDL